MQRDLFKVVLFITCMLVENEQISIIAQSTQDKAFVELTYNSQLLEVIFSEHHRERIADYHDVLCIDIITLVK